MSRSARQPRWARPATDILVNLDLNHVLPVDHAVDEVDLVAVGGERHQNAAIHCRYAAMALIFGLEADRRAVGDDLQIMIGQPRQHRARGYVLDRMDIVRKPALFAKGAAEITDDGIVGATGKIEQHAVDAKVGVIRIEIVDRGIGTPLKQRYPVIIGANMHAAFIGTDHRRRFDRRLLRGGKILLDAIVVREGMRIVHASSS